MSDPKQCYPATTGQGGGSTAGSTTPSSSHNMTCKYLFKARNGNSGTSSTLDGSPNLTSKEESKDLKERRQTLAGAWKSGSGTSSSNTSSNVGPFLLKSQKKKPLPVIFLSHGYPTSAFEQNDLSQFWKRLGSAMRQLSGVHCILIISAHWVENPVKVNTSESLQTMHNYYGFPRKYKQYSYPGRGSPQVASRVLQLLTLHGIKAVGDSTHGLDHGSWVPLKWILPGGNVPVVQLSLLDGGSMQEHIALGKALAPLRNEGVVIVCSGSAVHNVKNLGYYYFTREVASYVQNFDKALERAVVNSHSYHERKKKLLRLQQHPLLHDAHPSLEHLLPMYIAAGAAGSDACHKVFHKMEMSFSNASFVFGDDLLL